MKTLKYCAAAILTAALVWTAGSTGRDTCNQEIEGGSARLAFRNLALQDENGVIPVDGWANAYQQKEEMVIDNGSWIEFVPDQQTVPLPPPLPWIEKGPGNIGGRIRSIIIDPRNDNKMMVGGVTGGIWRTNDGGVTWGTNTDFLANLNVSCMAARPDNPDIIYAGTGGETHRGAGIFKSTNGGESWARISSTANPDFYGVYRMAISPTNPNYMLAGTYTGVFRSTNGGDVWVKVLSGEFFDVLFHPNDWTKCMASDRTGHAYYSTNSGVTWNASQWGQPTPYGTMNLEYAKSDPQIVYALAEWSASDSGWLFRSTDGGLTFRPRGGCCNSVLWWANCLWVDPTDPDFVLFGGANLFRSTDGGLTGALFNFVNTPHMDHQIVVEKPGFGVDNKTVYCGTDGGIFKCPNIRFTPDVLPPHGQSLVPWESLNHNLAITQFLGAAGNAHTGVIVGGTQDNGTLSSLTSWRDLSGGDGGPCAADQADPRYFYGGYQYLGLIRSKDGGQSMQYIANALPHECNGGSCSNWTAPIMLDPNNSNALLAGGDKLWRSTNIKENNPALIAWPEIKPRTPTGSLISALAVQEGNSNHILVGHNDGSLYWTTNGKTWVKATGLPQRYISDVAIARTSEEPAAVYVTFGGFTAGNVWKGFLGENNWTDISSGRLPYAPVHSIVVSRRDSRILYIGTEIGVFASSNTGQTWSPSQGGPANVVVFDLSWMGDYLLSPTFGRGAFTLGPLVLH